MIKSILHKGFAVFLAIVLLVSTFSFTIEKHFCGDFLIDVAIFTEVEKCSDEAFEIELEQITKKPCCKDIVDVIEGQQTLQEESFEDLKLNKQIFLFSFVYSFLNPEEDLSQYIVPHKNYAPPRLIYDINLLDEVYLI